MVTKCRTCKKVISDLDEYCDNCLDSAYRRNSHMIDPVTVLIALMAIAIIVITLGRIVCG